MQILSEKPLNFALPTHLQALFERMCSIKIHHQYGLLRDALLASNMDPDVVNMLLVADDELLGVAIDDLLNRPQYDVTPICSRDATSKDSASNVELTNLRESLYKKMRKLIKKLPFDWQSTKKNKRSLSGAQPNQVLTPLYNELRKEFTTQDPSCAPTLLPEYAIEAICNKLEPKLSTIGVDELKRLIDLENKQLLCSKIMELLEIKLSTIYSNSITVSSSTSSIFSNKKRKLNNEEASCSTSHAEYIDATFRNRDNNCHLAISTESMELIMASDLKPIPGGKFRKFPREAANISEPSCFSSGVFDCHRYTFDDIEKNNILEEDHVINEFFNTDNNPYF